MANCHCIGLTCSSGHGDYYCCTGIVTFTPYFLLKESLGEQVGEQQDGRHVRFFPFHRTNL